VWFCLPAFVEMSFCMFRALLTILALRGFLSIRKRDSQSLDTNNSASNFISLPRRIERYTWSEPVANDAAIIMQIRSMLPSLSSATVNPLVFDARASYEPKVFGEIRVTGAQNEHWALALHVVHRHGFGALIVAHKGGLPQPATDALDLAKQIEEDPQVQELIRLLTGLSHDALNAFHSYDHNPSCWHPSLDKNCLQHNVKGALQAMKSLQTYNFLKGTCMQCGLAKALQDQWFPELYSALQGLRISHVFADGRCARFVGDNGRLGK